MSNSHKLRSRFGVIISILIWAVTASGVASLAFTPNPIESLLRYSWPFLAFALGVWLLYWRPYIEISEELITVVNPLSEYRFNYSAILHIETKFTLSVQTETKKVEVWAAPAPSRIALYRFAKPEGKHLPASTYVDGTIGHGDIPSSDSGSAAYILRRHWQHKTEAGLKTPPAFASERHWIPVACFAALIAASVIAPLL